MVGEDGCRCGHSEKLSLRPAGRLGNTQGLYIGESPHFTHVKKHGFLSLGSEDTGDGGAGVRNLGRVGEISGGL